MNTATASPQTPRPPTDAVVRAAVLVCLLDGPGDAPALVERTTNLLAGAYTAPTLSSIHVACERHVRREYAERIDESCDVELTEKGRALLAEYRSRVGDAASRLSFTRELAIGGWA